MCEGGSVIVGLNKCYLRCTKERHQKSGQVTKSSSVTSDDDFVDSNYSPLVCVHEYLVYYSIFPTCMYM